MFNFKEILSLLMETNIREKNDNNIYKLEKIIRKELRNKYFCSYDYFIIENILSNKRTHLVESFKDYLLIDYTEEFLKKYYKRNEVSEIIYNLYIYYKKYLYFFCKPTFRKIIYNYIIYKGEEKKANLYYDNFFKNKKKERIFNGMNSNAILDLSKSNSLKKDNIENIIFDESIKRKIESNKSKGEIEASFKLSESSIKFNKSNENENNDSNIYYNYNYNDNSIINIVTEINKPNKHKQIIYNKSKEIMIKDNNKKNKIYDKVSNAEFFEPKKDKLIINNIKNRNNHKLPQKYKNNSKFALKFINIEQKLILPSYNDSNNNKINLKKNKKESKSKDDKHINKHHNKFIIDRNRNRNIFRKNNRSCENKIIINKISIINDINKSSNENADTTHNTHNTLKTHTPEKLKNKTLKNNKKEIEVRKNKYNKYINNSTNKKIKNEIYFDIFIPNEVDIINKKINYKNTICYSSKKVKRNINILNNNSNTNDSNNKNHKEIIDEIPKNRKSFPKNNLYNKYNTKQKLSKININDYIIRAETLSISKSKKNEIDKSNNNSLSLKENNKFKHVSKIINSNKIQSEKKVNKSFQKNDDSNLKNLNENDNFYKKYNINKINFQKYINKKKEEKLNHNNI